MSNLKSLTVMPNDMSSLVYLLDLAHELFRVVGDIHVSLEGLGDALNDLNFFKILNKTIFGICMEWPKICQVTNF